MATKGTKLSDEHKRKISEARKGIKFSDEQKKKMSEARMGKKNPNHSEWMKKHSEGYWKGKKRYPETVEKMKAVKGEKHWHYGGVDSEETKKKRAESRTVHNAGDIWINDYDNARRMIKMEDGSTMMYARYLMQVKIGRVLTRADIVHHINGDWKNDNIDNLVLMTRSSHMVYHSSHRNL